MRRHVPEGTLTPEQVLEGGKKTYFEKTPTQPEKVKGIARFTPVADVVDSLKGEARTG